VQFTSNWPILQENKRANFIILALISRKPWNVTLNKRLFHTPENDLNPTAPVLTSFKNTGQSINTTGAGHHRRKTTPLKIHIRFPRLSQFGDSKSPFPLT
jgi:hypothetical protein